MLQPPCFNLQRSSLDTVSFSRSLSLSKEFSIQSQSAVSPPQAFPVCRLGSSGSEPHPVVDLLRSSSNPYTSTLPQLLTPHLPVVAMVKFMKLTIIWRRHSHSGFITTILTLPLRPPPLPRLSPSVSPAFPLALVTPRRRVSVRKPVRSLVLSFHCVVRDLRFSSGLDESYGFRYGNIRVLLSWISVCVPLWITVKSIVSSRRRVYYTPHIEGAPSHQGFYGAKLHRFGHVYLTAADLYHYAVSSIDGSSKNRICGFPGVVARGTNHPEAFYLLSDISSHIFWLIECDDCMLRSSSVTNYWTLHGSVEFRSLDPSKPSAPSSNSILSASFEMKLELEIHLVSSVSFVGFKAGCTCFNAISSQIGLHTLIVAYGSGASHLKFLAVDNPMSYSFILPSSMSPGSSISVVDFHAL
ncbi:hypothetical protein Bca52824_007104 [Brassica carinata]|uniref:Uncharacterized protein n=1 Tax=Brassica carinata TaxID=52824 RepID=A0A8X7W6W4_BRACI|nr:hypothetical protein Bca52824_007104 [Brassica carinata]